MRSAVLAVMFCTVYCQASELSGSRLPPTPYGYVHTRGVCVGAPGEPSRDCRYSIAILDDAAGVAKMVLGARLDGYDSAMHPKWIVLDSFGVPPIPSGFALAYGSCSYKELADSRIIAVAKYDASSQWLGSVLWARRLNTESGAWEDVEVDGVRCVNEGFGEGDRSRT